MRVKNNALLGDFVYEHLKSMILTNKIKCGEKIQEQQIEHELGVSRTPVREAVRRLANQGVITLYPNRYAEVITFDKQSIKDLGMVRITLDCLAAQLAVQTGSNRDFDMLKDTADKCLDAHNKGEIYEQIQLDSDFHSKLVEITGNNDLIGLHKSTMLKTQLLQTSVVEDNTNFCDLDTHSEILAALYDRDTNKVLVAIQKHLAPFYGMKAADIKTVTFDF